MKETWTTAQLKCLYTNARSMGNKQEELEAIVHQENYDMVAIMETWWDDSHNWSAAMDGYKLFRRDRRGRRGGGVALYVRECLGSLELDDGDDRVECLWTSRQGRRPAWLTRELWLELRKKRRVYNLWKKGQASQEDYKGVARLCREKIRRAKAELDLNLAAAVKDNKKHFFKYISSKRRAKGNLSSP
ncbi:hypothetical protein QYF61_015148 [Mycteria americana]|uniref:Endonuclease/exonuclease/phosphatase domain-containing protein n=1 Tax=Mycteria americana TaxID=33587 RepID=A0AAN7NLS4_MYCAM|nr:hypothetical protein QYF61_015148 [Mycteria americana]